MTIDTKRVGNTLTIAVEGELNTQTVPDFQAAIQQNIGGVTKLIFDFSKLSYLTSAGLRVLMIAQKTMDRQGEMEVFNLNEAVRDVFAMTGFLDIITVLP